MRLYKNLKKLEDALYYMHPEIYDHFRSWNEIAESFDSKEHILNITKM